MALARPMDQDTKYYQPQPMDKGLYKFQNVDWKEWATNHDLNFKGLVEKLTEQQVEKANVISIRWELHCVEAPYEGRRRYFWTPYWARDEYIEAGLEKKIVRYLDNNPTAERKDAEKTVEPWRPQEMTYDYLWACGLMAKDEEQEIYKRIGWAKGEEEQAFHAAIGRVVWGDIGPNESGTREDDLLGVSPVLEQ